MLKSIWRTINVNFTWRKKIKVQCQPGMNGSIIWKVCLTWCWAGNHTQVQRLEAWHTLKLSQAPGHCIYSPTLRKTLSKPWKLDKLPSCQNLVNLEISASFCIPHVELVLTHRLFKIPGWAQHSCHELKVLLSSADKVSIATENNCRMYG